MKQRLIIAVLVMLLPACGSLAAELELSETVIDYGTVKEGPPVIKTVTITNKGLESVTIAKAVAS
jgi:hypothetical protein